MFQVIQYTQEKNEIKIADRVMTQLHEIAHDSFNVWSQIAPYQVEAFKSLKMGMLPNRLVQRYNPFSSPPHRFNAEIAVPGTDVQNRLPMNGISKCRVCFHPKALFAIVSALYPPGLDPVREGEGMPPNKAIDLFLRR